MLVNTDNTTETFAFGASTDRGVERKHLVIGLFKSNAVCFEFSTETVKTSTAIRLIETQETGTVTFIHRSLCRIGKAADGIFF